jgi:hypothetical protein
MNRASGKVESSIIRGGLDRLPDSLIENGPMGDWKAERAFIGRWMAKCPVPGHRRRWGPEDLHDRKSLR